MFKKGRLVILICAFFSLSVAAVPLTADPELLQILEQTDQEVQERAITKYLRTYYRSPGSKVSSSSKQRFDSLFTSYNVPNRQALGYFASYLYQQQHNQVDYAERSLVKAIQLVAPQRSTYLLYVFYNELGFLQTEKGNITEAVNSYSTARKMATAFDDVLFQVVVDVNISDAFYRNGFYAQSLSYLKRAQELVATKASVRGALKNTLYINLIENYYRMGVVDSVEKYNKMLRASPDSIYNKYMLIKRSDYYLSILRHQYADAVAQINGLKNDTLYNYNHNDDQILADAYYKAGMFDSARVVIDKLLKAPALKNHPEVKYQLYKILGQVSQQQHNDKAAADHFKMALHQSEEHMNRLAQVDNISSKIKLSEAQNAFTQKEESYKKERLGLIYVLVITLLTTTVIAMVFNAHRRKRYYERLVYDTRKTELSFIHSHEIRRHLSNLLGLIDVIRTSSDKHKQYLEAEPMILREAEALDGAIKTISEKLDADVVLQSPNDVSHSGMV